MLPLCAPPRATATAAEEEGRPIAGIVVDSRGAPVADALVELRRAGQTGASTRTDARGRFRLLAPLEAKAAIEVDAPGFSRWRGAAPDGGEDLRIVLSPAAFSERIAVSGSRISQRISETPGNVVVLSSEEIGANAVPILDRALRQVPGFTLFRRSDSRTANPTTQGASLRGVGGSAGSRAAVLDDGVPLNDPFGGWVYWGRIPTVSLERAEVLQGGASDLYGGPALSGAVSLVRRDPSDSVALFEGSYASLETPQASLFASGRAGPWGATIVGEKFRTAGYVPVAPDARGAVDREANSRHEGLELTLERKLEGGSRLFLRGSTFDETRQNGTLLQRNDTRINQVVLGGDWAAAAGAFSLRLYGSDQSYHQTFSSISTDRSSETLTRAQTVPSRALGLTGQWSRGFGAHVLVAGVEGRTVRGESDEDVFGRTGTTFAGSFGRQALVGVFLEDLWTPSPRLLLTAVARFDGWRNFDAELDSGPSQSDAARRPLPDRSETAFSPRLSALYRMDSDLALTASAYRSFRAPTLNELYRTFRVGNVVTLANEDLEAERATGAEVGVILAPAARRASLRASVYWIRVDDPVANVTLSSTPSLITRQRENLGSTRSLGFELEGELRISPALLLSAGYLHADSKVESFEADRTLEGRRVPQVPSDQGSVRLHWASALGPVLDLQAQMVSSQFDDDQNAFRLGGFGAFDARLGWPVTPEVEVFAAGENLLDRRYEIGKTPVTTLGPPRSIRVGVRIRVGRG